MSQWLLLDAQITMTMIIISLIHYPVLRGV
nr:MAG TPA: hypothetical protein [Caudoviricetes sp.]